MIERGDQRGAIPSERCLTQELHHQTTRGRIEGGGWLIVLMTTFSMMAYSAATAGMRMVSPSSSHSVAKASSK